MTTVRLRFYFKILMITLFFFLSCGFQTSFWPNVITWLPSPQIWLLLVLFITLKWTPVFSIFYIYFLGFCLTRFTDAPLKMIWWSSLITFCVLWIIRNRVQMSGVLSFVLFCLGGSFIYQVSFYSVSQFIEKNPTTLLFTDRALQILINFIFSYPLYFIFEWLDQIFYSDDEWLKSSEKHEIDT